MSGFDKHSALKLVLFVLEYAIRYALVPGRVENWILIVDLEGVGLGAASSENRDIAKSIAVLLEQVYCGRNFCTKIMSLPWAIRSLVNAFIPSDKKEKVQFVGRRETESVMRGLFEPHQLEERYGGTAPDLEPQETYPFKFFPNCSGSSPAPGTADKSLDMFTDRIFHEGYLWDESTDSIRSAWNKGSLKQSLTPAAAKDLQDAGNPAAQPCQDLKRWFEIVNPEEAKQRS